MLSFDKTRGSCFKGNIENFTSMSLLRTSGVCLKEETVLRLKKKDNVCKTCPSACDDLKELENQIKMIRNVWKPFLGESFVNNPLIVFLRADDIKTLNEVAKQFRPAHRKHKNIVEQDTYVCMLPDYCCLPQNLKFLPTSGPVLCIEIKPKQGFMKEDHLPSSFSSLPLSKCRFCSMQRYKLIKGKISYKSEYCPTDLFSGCYSRMFHALMMLCKTPQNNLRIFKNQKLIYSEEKQEDLNELLSDFIPCERIRCMDLLCDLIIQTLLKPFPYGLHKSALPLQKTVHQNCINAYTICDESDPCHELPLYCILERILSCQCLDDLSIFDLYQLYVQINKTKNKGSDYIGCYSRSEIPPFLGQPRKVTEESDYQYASRKVWEFLVALTVKDCSIMITLKHLSLKSSGVANVQNVISDKYGNLYVFSIALADLDSKPLDRVEKVHDYMSLILKLNKREQNN